MEVQLQPSVPMKTKFSANGQIPTPNKRHRRQESSSSFLLKRRKVAKENLERNEIVKGKSKYILQSRNTLEAI